MPTYGYECNSCKHNFDVFQSMRDEPIKKCPQCGKAVRRLINGGNGVIFKGNGFYVTDKGGSNSAVSTGDSGKTASADSSSASACQSCPSECPMAVNS